MLAAEKKRSLYDTGMRVLALTLGLVIGWLDLYVTEVAVTIVALLAAGFLLGLLRPVSAWRWAILVVIGIPVMEIVAIGFGLETAEPVQIDVRIVLVTLIFTLVGTYAGVLVRSSSRRQPEVSDSKEDDGQIDP